ncbi:GNAT family N-acetyltransferase [Kitasatospora sp. NPDC008115]|uniref:GNAT family N-acetyltransferase n=1 Tax=Kitasatospora sp. NPDC008115 TaxID=3364022 RepID=UPI0036EBE899
MEIRSTTEQDREVFVDTFHAAFGRFPEPTAEDGGGAWWSAVEMDRGVLAVADGRPVGTAGAYSFELTLPGEVIAPVAGVTVVGVVPSHRRRGVLTAMMRHQLAELRERGEFLSVLLASEAVIYRRFGYGPATYTGRLTVQRERAGLAAARAAGAGADAGSVEVLRSGECREVLEDVYDRYRRAQPGAISRPHRWWELRAGQPPISGTPRYIALHRDADGVPDGYASYSLSDGVPDAVRRTVTLTVDEIIALDDTAYTALARYALGHDLITEVVFKHVPADHPLRWQLADFRAGVAGSGMDWLWVRLLDVPRALTTRGWFADGDLVLDVQDRFLGEHGRYLLTVRDGKAECVPTDDEPDLSLDASDLGSLYLGGTTPSTLIRAGHIHAHHPEAATQADTLFRTARPPFCLHWF